MRTRLQALLNRTAIAATIAAAVWLSASITPAHADELGDTIKSSLQTTLAGLPANQVAAIRNVLNGTTDGATMLSQLNSLTGLPATVAVALGRGLGSASNALAASNPTGASQIQAAVANNGNPMVSTSFAGATLSAGGGAPIGGGIVFGGGLTGGGNTLANQLMQLGLGLNNAANNVARAMKIGPYGT